MDELEDALVSTARSHTDAHAKQYPVEGAREAVVFLAVTSSITLVEQKHRVQCKDDLTEEAACDHQQARYAFHGQVPGGEREHRGWHKREPHVRRRAHHLLIVGWTDELVQIGVAFAI